MQAQLDALIHTRVREDGDTLNPESITVLDPACGSGHILVVAYDVLKVIYLERGYQPRAIPRLILEKNLYGLDIDDRAAQMTGFALVMKARADDRRLFTATDDAGNLLTPKLNVLSLQESKGLSVDELATHLAPFKVQRATITALVDTFEHAKTFGSLIQIPYALKTHVTVLPEVLALVKQSGDLYATSAADDLLPLVQQAQVLAMQFDAVVANPPYMGARNGMNPSLKTFAGKNFPDSKADLFAMFIERAFDWCKSTGFNCMVTMQSWMFLSSYEEMREKLLRERTILTMAHLGARAFNEISGEVVQTTAFVIQERPSGGFKPVFLRLVEGQEEQKEMALRAGQPRFDTTIQDDFKKIPGGPIAYWAKSAVVSAFENSTSFEQVAEPRQGMATGNNSIFVRAWHEIDYRKMGVGFTSKEAAWSSEVTWVPYNKGGEFRKWYGNNDFLIRFNKSSYETLRTVGNHCPSEKYYFREGITWGLISSAEFSCRYMPSGFVFDVGGSSAFPAKKNLGLCLGLLNSKLTSYFISILNPTLNTQVGDLKRFPVLENSIANAGDFGSLTEQAIAIAKFDWDSEETSWDFARLDFVENSAMQGNLEAAWENSATRNSERLGKLKLLEEENNRLFINAYGLQDELSPEVPESQITLARADREKDCQRLISYAIGCMMGRYSLDEPGLIYAHAGNVGFEPGRHTSFHADADGIVPITDELWFADDAPSRISEFLRAVWGPQPLEENMAWLAESLSKKSAKEASETPDETIRRYIADKFFKDHLQAYKKRPIYWLFSSGKQGAFQALVYLHRYHEGTLARMRAEYVVPLTGKIQSRIEMLQKDATVASSTAARNKLAKEVEKLKKKHGELLAYDEQLRHYADMRITLDLDDGVKVNYGKFGDLLAEVKAVTGGASDD